MSSEKRSRPSLFRRKYLVRKDFQVVLVAIPAAILTTGFLSSIVIFYFFTEQNLTTSFQDFQLSINKTNDYLLPLLLGINGLLCFPGLILITFVVITRTHRIAGPLVNLSNFFRKLKEEGDLAQVFKTRETDQLKDIEQGFNELLVSWRKRVSALKEDAASLSSLIRDLTVDTAEQENIRKKIVETADELQNKLDYYKT
ncbi:MAG: methyl-accepting chemotaxis protein [Desulfobulbaceae bacterium]|nr:methyl-accepting chemotaxis protein [Desulfobulbaceae bacterium]